MALKRLYKIIRKVYGMCLSRTPGTPSRPRSLWLGVRLRASRKMVGESLSTTRWALAVGTGGTLVFHGKETELSISVSGERAVVSNRSRKAESWAGSAVLRFVDGSRSMDRFVGMRAADLGRGLLPTYKKMVIRYPLRESGPGVVWGKGVGRRKWGLWKY